MERLPVKLILTNEEIDRLLQILERSGHPDAEHLMDRLYQQQTPDTDSPRVFHYSPDKDPLNPNTPPLKIKNLKKL